MHGNDALRLVLDEPQLFIEESMGSAMVRGEVIMYFSTDTLIQGPITVIFEGIQHHQTWKDVTKRNSTTPPIETKLYSNEVPLLPDLMNKIVPAGVHRFPFEFPIPASLPLTVCIPNRLGIFYQVTATLHVSNSSTNQQQISAKNLIKWALFNNNKQKHTASSSIRIISAIESSLSRRVSATCGDSTTSAPARARITPNNEEAMYEELVTNATTSAAVTTALAQALWNKEILHGDRGSLDEQYYHLASSMSGKTCSNLKRPIHTLKNSEGIRYKLGVDRTAIAIGTSVGIELMIEPTLTDAVVKSAVLRINEHRRYNLKTPSSGFLPTVYNSDRFDETEVKILNWGNDYHVANEDDEMIMDKGSTSRPIGDIRNSYVHQRSTSSSQHLAYFDPPQPGTPNNKLLIGSTINSCCPVIDYGKEEDSLEKNGTGSFADVSGSMDLQELNQPVKLGEFFAGRFVLQVPGCCDVLHPSMEHESITISHWMQLVVEIECNGRTFYIKMDAPCRMLHCRLVLPDDVDQIIMSPPPSYDPSDVYNIQDRSNSSFWEQREAITTVSGWGYSIPCPCEVKKMERASKDKSSAASGKTSKKNKTTTLESIIHAHLLPELDPPPAYEN